MASYSARRGSRRPARSGAAAGGARATPPADAPATGRLPADVALAPLLDDAPAAQAMLDRELRCLGASRRWRSDFGIAAVELAGHMPWRALAAGRRNGGTEVLARLPLSRAAG